MQSEPEDVFRTTRYKSSCTARIWVYVLIAGVAPVLMGLVSSLGVWFLCKDCETKKYFKWPGKRTKKTTNVTAVSKAKSSSTVARSSTARTPIVGPPVLKPPAYGAIQSPPAYTNPSQQPSGGSINNEAPPPYAKIA